MNVKLTGKGTQSEMLLSNDNASQAGAAAIQSTHLISTTGLLLGNIQASNVSSKNPYTPPLKRILDEVLTIMKTQRLKARISNFDIRSQGSGHYFESCIDGGTLSINAIWEGPAEPEDPSEIMNLNATITFNSCCEESITFKGSMKVIFEGSADNPSKITISTSTFFYTDSDYNDHITLTNFKIIITDFVLSDDELESGTITLKGALSGTVDADFINEECDYFTIAFNSTAYGEVLTMSGNIKPSCIGGWVTVTTNTPILIPGDDVCPTAGEIVITSNADNVRVVISSDYKITIYFNDVVVQTFNDCEEVDGLCVG